VPSSSPRPECWHSGLLLCASTGPVELKKPYIGNFPHRQALTALPSSSSPSPASRRSFLYSKSSRACHPERRASSAKRDKRKSKDPEDLSSAMPIQGVLFENFCATILAHAWRLLIRVLGLHSHQPYRHALHRGDRVLRSAYHAAQNRFHRMALPKSTRFIGSFTMRVTSMWWPPSAAKNSWRTGAGRRRSPPLIERWIHAGRTEAGKCGSGDNLLRERLESARHGTHSGGPSTCPYPASRDSRGAQDDKL